MPKQAATADGNADIVVLQYEDLLAGSDLTAEIERAFGYDGMGILTVAGVPGISDARDRLLPLAHRFAMLPEKTKAKYEHAGSFYAVGWSFGREKLQGRPDVSKGSYYANPLQDKPFDDAATIAAHPAFAEPNIWPSEELPALRGAFMEAGQLMHRVGCLVAAQCDAFVRARCDAYPADRLQHVIKTSRCCKGRLLHYFPIDTAGRECAASHEASDSAAAQSTDDEFSNWCAVARTS
eukprot:6183805-Pleurochrysis_carterae.AAC.2